MTLTTPDLQDGDLRVVVLLVDDQQIIAEAVRRMFADEPDIDFHYCGQPTRALVVAMPREG